MTYLWTLVFGTHVSPSPRTQLMGSHSTSHYIIDRDLETNHSVGTLRHDPLPLRPDVGSVLWGNLTVAIRRLWVLFCGSRSFWFPFLPGDMRTICLHLAFGSWPWKPSGDASVLMRLCSPSLLLLGFSRPPAQPSSRMTGVSSLSLLTRFAGADRRAHV